MLIFEKLRNLPLVRWSMGSVLAAAMASAGCAFEEGHRRDHDEFRARDAGYYEGDADRHERHWDPSHEWESRDNRSRDRDGHKLDRYGNRTD